MFVRNTLYRQIFKTCSCLEFWSFRNALSHNVYHLFNVGRLPLFNQVFGTRITLLVFNHLWSNPRSVVLVCCSRTSLTKTSFYPLLSLLRTQQYLYRYYKLYNSVTVSSYWGYNSTSVVCVTVNLMLNHNLFVLTGNVGKRNTRNRSSNQVHKEEAKARWCRRVEFVIGISRRRKWRGGRQRKSKESNNGLKVFIRVFCFCAFLSKSALDCLETSVFHTILHHVV